MKLESAVLLVGSARPAGESTSESLGRYLLERLEAGGATTEVHRVSHTRSEETIRRLAEELDQTDLFVLSSPLYVDTLPYLATRALERIHAHRVNRPWTNPCWFLAIVNCGFPEARHTATALDICRTFAERARFSWACGLGLGGGEMIHGRRLEEMGPMASSVTRSLDLAAEALLEDRPIPTEAVQLMARPLIPDFLYTMAGNLRWRRAALRNRAFLKLKARPLESPDRE